MVDKLRIEDLEVGDICETTFWANPVESSEFRSRATHLNGKKAPKVALCDDPRITPGVLAQVRIIAIPEPKRGDRGSIEVEFVDGGSFQLEGIYLDPQVSKKLQVLLESGLNILLDGPQGCVRTSTARAIADALGMEFVFFNCASVAEPTDFLATLQLRAGEGGAPETRFLSTILRDTFLLEHERPRRRYLVFFDGSWRDDATDAGMAWTIVHEHLPGKA